MWVVLPEEESISMNITLHKNARATPAVRLEWQRSDRPVKELAARYNISEATVRKWRRHWLLM